MFKKRANVREFSSVVIVGAGPAGLGTAFQLAGYGTKCTVIDENSRIGGVVYRGALRNNIQNRYLDDALKADIEDIHKKYSQYSDSIHLILQTRVMGSMKRDRQLALYNTQNRIFPYDYGHLMICTGCYERAVPFPGWMLPGVMSIGGVQIQIKSGLVRPAKQMVLVGTGPLLLVTATQLHKAGVNVLGVYEAGRRCDLVRSMFALLKNKILLKEGIRYLHYLKQARIPVKFGWGIVEAKGEGELAEVVVAPYDRNWRPINKKTRTIKTDGLGIGYGFTPRNQLSQMLDVRQEYVPHSGFRPITDDWMRTSKKHIQVAGDVAGIYGAQVAAEQGKISALGYLMDTGNISRIEAERAASSIRKKINQYKAFQDAFAEFSRPGEGLLELARGDTIICRCENTTHKQLDEAICNGAEDIVALKMSTRTSMGDCQGKLCAGYCYEYMRKRLKKKHVGELRPRFPLSPMSFDAMLSGRSEES